MGIIVPSPKTVAPAIPGDLGIGPSICLITISCSPRTRSTSTASKLSLLRRITMEIVSSC